MLIVPSAAQQRRFGMGELRRSHDATLMEIRLAARGWVDAI
jgi:hypothetical protein